MVPLRLVVGKKQKDFTQMLDFDEVRMPRLVSVNVGLPRNPPRLGSEYSWTPRGVECG